MPNGSQKASIQEDADIIIATYLSNQSQIFSTKPNDLKLQIKMTLDDWYSSQIEFKHQGYKSISYTFLQPCGEKILLFPKIIDARMGNFILEKSFSSQVILLGKEPQNISYHFEDAADIQDVIVLKDQPKTSTHSVKADKALSEISQNYLILSDLRNPQNSLSFVFQNRKNVTAKEINTYIQFTSGLIFMDTNKIIELEEGNENQSLSDVLKTIRWPKYKENYSYTVTDTNMDGINWEFHKSINKYLGDELTLSDLNKIKLKHTDMSAKGESLGVWYKKDNDPIWQVLAKIRPKSTP